MPKYAILIAVEEYSDANIKAVPHAKHDAEEFSTALEQHGFKKADQLVLINSQATQGVIKSKVSKVIQRLQDDDVLYFYYAGHAFSLGDRNFITCHDTQDSDWDGTSVALDPILTELHSSKCNRMVLFLDVCASGIRADNLNERELETFLDGAKNCLCFAARRSDESSYSSGQLRHGIWAYHILQAFRGDAPLALERGLLTVNSLQNYLMQEVPRTLRKTIRDGAHQTPWMYGTSSGDFILADLRGILKARRDAANQGNHLVAELSFVVEVAAGLRSLSGWKKGFRIPDHYSDSAERFVTGLAGDELRKDLDGVYAKLKSAFGFVRRDLDASDPMDGSATITTPHFNYSVAVSLNPANLEEVIWSRSVNAIKSPGQVTSSAFGEVFDGVFDTLELARPGLMNVEEFIDAAEAAKIPGVKIDYDRECTYCKLDLPGSAGTVTLKAGSLSIVHDRPKKTQQLIESFDTVRKLVSQHNVPLISFAASATRPPG